MKTQSELNALMAFFSTLRGRTKGFRFKDRDAQAGDVQPLPRPNKPYTGCDHKIANPVEGTVTVSSGSTPVAFTVELRL